MSSNAGEWIVELCESYKATVRTRERQIQALSDDYVKFLRLAQWHIERTACGVVAMITNNGYLGGHLFVDMRASLRRTFESLHVLNLHGSLRMGEQTPEGHADGNVFEIQTGVAITLAERTAAAGAQKVLYADSWGTREAKYARLVSQTIGTTPWQVLALNEATAPWTPMSQDAQEAWAEMTPLTDIFGSGDRRADAQHRYAAGFVSQQDDFAIAFDKAEILERVALLLDPRTTEASLRRQFRLCTTTQWDFRRARQELGRADVKSLVTSCVYRPFDFRFTVFDRGVVSILRKELMRHLFHRDNVALLATRGVRRQAFAHVFASSRPVDRHALDNAGDSMFVFPLYVYPDSVFEEAASGLFGDEERVVNLSKEFRRKVTEALGLPAGPSAREIFAFVYAVLHSPTYRARYGQHLSQDFPRIPTPRGPALFRGLAEYGERLLHLHLMEGAAEEHGATIFTGPKNPEVGRVAWSDDAVWLDSIQTARGSVGAPGAAAFHGVTEDVWRFYVGGYQVCEKWLKDRKGRKLSKAEIAHFQKIVAALGQTIQLMAGVDEIIEKHGGWPGAFKAGEAKAATPSVVPFRPRLVQPGSMERYVTCVPLVPLKAAAGTFGDPQRVENEGLEWVAVAASHRLRPGMFVAQVVGKSMEPAIPDGSYCLFASPVEGSRRGKTVLVQLRDTTDPETGERYTVKCYESEKIQDDGSWRHIRVILKPVNPAFAAIMLSGDEGELAVVAELVGVLREGATPLA